MQDYSTCDMAHKIPRCIEWITSIHTLEPGDIIATGTNHKGLNPFQDEDRIEMETAGLGRLHVRVRDDLKRTWARETDSAPAETPGRNNPAADRKVRAQSNQIVRNYAQKLKRSFTANATSSWATICPIFSINRLTLLRFLKRE